MRGSHGRGCHSQIKKPSALAKCRRAFKTRMNPAQSRALVKCALSCPLLDGLSTESLSGKSGDSRQRIAYIDYYSPGFDGSFADRPILVSAESPRRSRFPPDDWRFPGGVETETIPTLAATTTAATMALTSVKLTVRYCFWYISLTAPLMLGGASGNVSPGIAICAPGLFSFPGTGNSGFPSAP